VASENPEPPMNGRARAVQCPNRKDKRPDALLTRKTGGFRQSSSPRHSSTHSAPSTPTILTTLEIFNKFSLGDSSRKNPLLQSSKLTWS
jgi:hypothetical protein